MAQSRTSTPRTTAKEATEPGTAASTASKTASKTPAKKSPAATALGAKAPSRSKHKPAKSPAVSSKTAAPAKASGGSSPAAQLTEYRRKRDFTKTAEPAGAGARRPPRANKAPHARETSESAATKPARQARTGELRFVIQKHAASHLHYDLRLEIDGVMKSWAVPKGPSADPSVKRLAMQVEDHPIEYNSFEGTIPAGEYGGGTVMLWDTGSYTIEDAGDVDQNSAAHDEYDRGELKLGFDGKRIRGSYALVRTKGNMRGGSSSKPSWLLLKHRGDDVRSSGDDLTDEYTTSVVSGRSMDEISDAG